MAQQTKNYTLPIVMMVILFGMTAFVTSLAAPMGIVLKHQFGVSNALGMLGNFANFIAYACMGIPAGLLLQRMGYKKTALLAIAVGFIGVCIQYLSGCMGSFTVYLLGAFVAGFSMCMLNTVINPMMNLLGGGGNKGNQLILVGGTCYSLSATIVPMLVGALVGDASKANITDVYPIIYMAMGIFAFIFLVLAYVRIPEPHSTQKVASPARKDKYTAWSFRHFVLGIMAVFIYTGVEVGIPGTMNLFLTDENAGGLDATTAGFVVGTYWFLMFVGRFIGSGIASKVSSKTMLAVVSSIGLILVVVAILSPVALKISIPVLQSNSSGISFGMTLVPISAMFLVLVGLCTSIMWGSIFNLAVEGLGKYMAAASGIYMMMVCGGGVLPLIQNFIVDVTSYLTSYWMVFIELAYVLYYALIGSRNVNKHIPVD